MRALHQVDRPVVYAATSLIRSNLEALMYLKTDPKAMQLLLMKVPDTVLQVPMRTQIHLIIG